MCPPIADQPEGCRTCCCKSSDNVDFFHPEAASQTECGATDDAEYKVSLIPTVSDICHPDLPFPGNSEFSDLLIASHAIYQVFTRAITERDDLYPYILYQEQALPFVEVALEQEVRNGVVHDYFLPDVAGDQVEMKRRVGEIEVTPYARSLILISTVVSVKCILLYFPMPLY